MVTVPSKSFEASKLLLLLLLLLQSWFRRLSLKVKSSGDKRRRKERLGDKNKGRRIIFPPFPQNFEVVAFLHRRQSFEDDNDDNFDNLDNDDGGGSASATIRRGWLHSTKVVLALPHPAVLGSNLGVLWKKIRK